MHEQKRNATDEWLKKRGLDKSLQLDVEEPWNTAAVDTVCSVRGCTDRPNILFYIQETTIPKTLVSRHSFRGASQLPADGWRGASQEG